MNKQKPCYGKILHNFTHEHLNERKHPKVFALLVENSGLHLKKHTLTGKRAEWEDGLQSSNYRICYELIMAKLQPWKPLQDFD